MKMLRRILPLIGLAALSVLSSCNAEDYGTGDGKYSYLRADFTEAFTDNNGEMTRAITDDNETLNFAYPLKVDGMSTPDSIYRVLLYYNKEEKAVTPVTVGNVLMPVVREAKDMKDKSTDPVQFDSSWMSRNGRYINFGLTVKTGKANEDKKQLIGLSLESCEELADGTKEARLLLIHDQNDVPEYYSMHLYMSIAKDRIPCELKEGDKVTVVMNTYKGEIEKTFCLH